MLKPTDNLEKSHFVIVEDKRRVMKIFLIKPEDFKRLIDRGENIPKEITHYVALHNKRNEKAIIRSLLSNKCMDFSYFKL